MFLTLLKDQKHVDNANQALWGCFFNDIKGIDNSKISNTFKCRVKPLATSFNQPKDLGALQQKCHFQPSETWVLWVPFYLHSCFGRLCNCFESCQTQVVKLKSNHLVEKDFYLRFLFSFYFIIFPMDT